MTKVANTLCRDDTVHGVDYYAAKEVDAIIADLTRERTHANDCFDAANEEIKRLTGESGVLRGLLRDAIGVLETIVDDDMDTDGRVMLSAIKNDIAKAITPQAGTWSWK